MGVRSADVTEQRQTGRLGSGLGHSQRNAQDRVGAELALIVGAVNGQHLVVDQPLLARVVAQQARLEVVHHGLHCLLHPLAQVSALVPVTALDRFEGASRGSGRDGCTTNSAVVQTDFDLDRGVATGVQDFAGNDGVDDGHENTPRITVGA